MKYKTILLSVLALLCAVAQVSAWDENGSQDNPWLIRTAADLNRIAERVNSGKRNYSGKYFRLVADINYEHTSAWNDYNNIESNYTPIGTDDYHFCGKFNGNGHTISGIRVCQDAESQGLFGNIGTGAYVHDIILTDTRITGTNDVGGIVGYKGQGTVRNCIVSPTVAICSYNNNGSYHGGIVGRQKMANSKTVPVPPPSTTKAVAAGVSSMVPLQAATTMPN